MRILKTVLFCIGLSTVLLALSLLPQRPLLAAPSDTTFTVNTTEDLLDDTVNDGECLTSEGTCALRAAIMQANHLTGPGVTTIILPAGTYTLTRPASSAGEDQGDLNLTIPLAANQEISLVGAGANVTIIDANQIDRVMIIDYQRVASLSGVTLRGGFRSDVAGGGLYNDGTTTVRNVTMSGNQAKFGAGIYNGAGATLTVIDSTVSQNTSTGDGGGIYNYSILTIINSTISLNNAYDDGGGLYNNGVAQANVYNATILSNEANSDSDPDGLVGGVYNESGGVLSLRSSLVAGNYRAGAPVYDDCTGAIGLYGNNLLGLSAQGLSDCSILGTGIYIYLNSMAFIGDLQDNGGATWTHALLPGSNAIDLVNTICVGPDSNLLPTDQRGTPRVIGSSCDIGAFEYNPPVFLPLVVR